VTQIGQPALFTQDNNSCLTKALLLHTAYMSNEFLCQPQPVNPDENEKIGPIQMSAATLRQHF